MRTLLLALGLTAFGACTSGSAPATDPDSAAVPEAGAFPVPADSGALAPRLALDASGRPLLSWVEPDGDGYALRYARWADGAWDERHTADRGDDWFINWADTPGVVPVGARLVAHTLPLHPEADGPYHYDAAVRIGDGTTWGERRLVNDDGVLAEHGFVSIVPLADGSAGVVWLDGRATGGGHGHGGGAMSLRYATLGLDGALADEAQIDARTCDCCPTAAVDVPGGLIVAYRDRTEAEVRDIAVVRLVDGEWTEPVFPHADGWEIAGCPVNGPALASAGARVALAWFTEADGEARVQVAISEDGGETFGPAVRVDDGAPIGRVAVVLRDDGVPVVSWLEHAGEAAELRVRTAEAKRLGDAATVATVDAGRGSGVPVMVGLGDRVLVAWTGAGTVQSAVVVP